MITPLELTLDGVYSHVGRTLNYCPGTTIFIGKNGSGKSTLVDVGQFFIQTGELPKGTLKKSMESWGSPKGKGTFRFLDEKGTEYLLTRSVVGTSVSLEWEMNGDTCCLTEPDEVSKMLEELYECPLDRIRELNSIPQDSLMDVLNMTQSRFLEYLQKIIPGLEEAEDIRADVQSWLNSHPVEVISVEEIQALKVEIAEQLSRIPAMEESLQNEKALAAELEEFRIRYETVRKLEVLDGKSQEDALRELESRRTDIQVQMAELDRRQADILNLPPPPDTGVFERQNLTPGAYAGRVRTIETEQARLEEEEKKYAAAEEKEKMLADAVEVIGGKVEEYAEKLNTLKATRIRKREKLELAEKGSCPTCGREISVKEEMLEKEREKVRKLDTAISSLENLIAEAGRSMKGMKADHRTALAEMNGCRVAVDSIRSSLERTVKLRESVGMDPDEVVSVLIPALEKHAADQKTLQDIAAKTRSLAQEDRGVAAAIDKYASGTVTREELELCRGKAHDWQQIMNGIEGLQQSITSLRSRIEVQQERLQEMQRKREENLRKEKVLTVFSDVRDMFHKSRIPKHAVTRAVHSINGRMQRLLSAFGQPFTAYFNDDFDLLCDFPERGRTGCQARNTLSGGQKVAVGIVFHLAKAELLGSSFPIFVLDEPTAFLDTQAKIALVDILNDIRLMAEKGLYFMIPTHENVLLDCATSVVNLDE